MNSPNLLAHLTNVDGVRKEQSLKEHCLQTAEYAAASIGKAKLFHLVHLAGIIHDMGKAKAEFVDYLEAAYQGEDVKRGTVNHTFAGVIWLLEKYHKEASTKWEKLTCEIIGYAIGSHHGMFDCADLDGKNGFLYRLQTDKEELGYAEAVQNFFAQVVEEAFIEGEFQKAKLEVEEFFKEAKNTYGTNANKVFFQISMLVRLTLSAVIYGDRRDTSEFMSQHMDQKDLGQAYESRWKARRDYFENKLSIMEASTALNQVRGDISRQCLEAAERPEGIYRLSVPTGAGKTLCTLRFALAHAEKYNKKRIIFIIPLLSVLDQNVKVIQDYVPDRGEVLEHHSNVLHERNPGEEADKYEFLGESWNYPIVVSTMVQLLNILFSHQTSAIGRMQALCDSVIVIDEVQSLPKKVTFMFNMAMNFLQRHCNATIVLSSATQPCFEELKWPLLLAEKPDMVHLNQEQLQVFERAQIQSRVLFGGMDWDECVTFCGEQMEQHTSLLVICNTKAEARKLSEKLQEQAAYGQWDIFHLSTAMCQAHRMDVLEQLRENLSALQQGFREHTNVRKLICISTQLIEAGVDISFSCVVRVLAGIDNLSQAAGRCNRSNEYGQMGQVYLISLKDENLNMLKDIRNAQLCTRNVLENQKSEEESLIGEQATRKFYRYLFEKTENEIRYPIEDQKTTFYLADLLSNDNPRAKEAEKFILRQPFKIVGRAFQVFDENTIDVVVPYKEGEYWMEQLRAMESEWFELEKFQEVIRQAQKYTVNLYAWQKQKLDQAGLLYSVLDGRVLLLDRQAYDEQFGVTVMDEQAVGHYVL
ncbi:MAG: CRISPR-associated helicase Cas3' [Acetatifactor sp.]|nr:CRISPR-associated helicase Cas3' [Acetatifactor sp.]